MTKPLTAETFIAWMWAYEYQFDSKADHSAFRNRFSRQIARLNEDAYRSDQRRPLTPDDITDEMVERAQRKIQRRATRIPAETIRLALIAALTEPPARPEGAEELETVIGLNAGKWTNGAEDVRALADLLASKGVRATEAE